MPPRETRTAKQARGAARAFWIWMAVAILILAALVMAAVALSEVFTNDAHWKLVNSTHVVSRHSDADVEIRNGSDFVLHNRILDGFEHIVYEKITLNPTFGPTGPDLLFGDAGATYTRLQAFFAIGLRVWGREFFDFGFPFTTGGLFGEPGLAVLVGSFATWVHGVIILPGPGILILSDETTKENIKSLDPAESMHRLTKLEPRSFDYKAASGLKDGQAKHLAKKYLKGAHGFVAQEVGSAIPQAVHSTWDYMPEEYRTGNDRLSLIDYNTILTELVAAYQAMWANGVLTAAEVEMGQDERRRAPPQRLPIAACFNSTTYPAPREKARCICGLQRCGPPQTCVGLARACGVSV